MKKILSIILLLFNALLTGIVAADRFEVIALSGPATAAPGEKITVNMTVKVKVEHNIEAAVFEWAAFNAEQVHTVYAEFCEKSVQTALCIGNFQHNRNSVCIGRNLHIA